MVFDKVAKMKQIQIPLDYIMFTGVFTGQVIHHVLYFVFGYYLEKCLLF